MESLQHNLTIYFDVKGHANQVPLIVLQPLLWVFSLFLLVSSWSLYHSAFSNMSENGSADCITQSWAVRNKDSVFPHPVPLS